MKLKCKVNCKDGTTKIGYLLDFITDHPNNLDYYAYVVFEDGKIMGTSLVDITILSTEEQLGDFNE